MYKQQQKTAWFLRDIWAKYPPVIFETPEISLAAGARNSRVNLSEISLVVFIPNTPRNRAISCTNYRLK